MANWRVEATIVAREDWLVHVEADTEQEALAYVRSEGRRNFQPEEFEVSIVTIEEVGDGQW